MRALAASGLLWLISGPMGIGPGAAFSLLGAITLLLTILTLYLLPDFLLRFMALVVMRVGYRLTITGRQHIPVEGAVYWLANRVSWVDSLILTGLENDRIGSLSVRER